MSALRPPHVSEHALAAIQEATDAELAAIARHRADSYSEAETSFLLAALKERARRARGFVEVGCG